MKTKKEYSTADLLKRARLSGSGLKTDTANNNGVYSVTAKSNGSSLFLRYIIGKYFADLVSQGKDIPAKKVSEKVALFSGKTKPAIALEKAITEIFGIKGKNGEGYGNLTSGRFPRELILNEEIGGIVAYSTKKNISDIAAYLNISEFGEIPVS